MSYFQRLTISILLASSAVIAQAESITVPMNLIDAKGNRQAIGTVLLEDSPYGLVLTPSLSSLPPGLHGFHVHEFPSCASAEKDGVLVPALAAGGHFDPAGTKRHSTPWGDGHLGDLPSLYVNLQGQAQQPVLAPRLRIKDVANKPLMIHAGGDNHSDHPAVLGGGGGRIACGVIP